MGEAGEHKDRRGFAGMSVEKQREIAAKGGRTAHKKGVGHEWTSKEAREAGRKGGREGHRRRAERKAAAAAKPAELPPVADDPGGRPDDAFK